jgi:hypothetical protein
MTVCQAEADKKRPLKVANFLEGASADAAHHDIISGR